MSHHVSTAYANPRAPYYRAAHYRGLQRPVNKRLLDGMMGTVARAEDRHAIAAELRRGLMPWVRDQLNREDAERETAQVRKAAALGHLANLAKLRPAVAA